MNVACSRHTSNPKPVILRQISVGDGVKSSLGLSLSFAFASLRGYTSAPKDISRLNETLKNFEPVQALSWHFTVNDLDAKAIKQKS